MADVPLPQPFLAVRVRKLDLRPLRPIAELKANPTNARIHSRRQLKQIAASIGSFGFNVPVLIDPEDQIIAGHGRVLACEILGITQVPTIRLEHLTKLQVRAFMIADNRLTETSEWDERLLAQQLKILSEAELDFNIEAIGFEMGEIDLRIESLSPAEDGDEDSVDVLPDIADGPTITQPGDLWILGDHRVLCGDSLNCESYSLLMESQRATAVITDPPFNVPIDEYVCGFGKVHHEEFKMASGEMTKAEFTEFLATAFARISESSIDGSLHYAFMDWRHSEEILKAAATIYSEFKALCIWDKGVGGQGSLYRSQHELVFVFKLGKGKHQNHIQLGQYGRYRTISWQWIDGNCGQSDRPVLLRHRNRAEIRGHHRAPLASAYR